MRFFLVLTLVFNTAIAFKRLYPTDGNIDKEKTSADLNEDNVGSLCSCDLTLNSCDAFCCCDNDCQAEVLNFWKENYNQYCAKNYISGRYNVSQCVVSSLENIAST